jgi:hypothetical protein
MTHVTISILSLCDEMLLAILNKLDNVDVLYSLIGVNTSSGIGKQLISVNDTRIYSACPPSISPFNHEYLKQSKFFLKF